MKVSPTIALTLLPAALAIAVGASARHLETLRSRVHWARASLAGTVETTQAVLDLRAKQQRIAEQKRPERDVIARVNAALTEAGISSDRFEGVRPESDSALPGSAGGDASAYRRQTVRLSLKRLSVGELGAFLGQWSVTQPIWTPTQIELLHVRDQRDEGRYDVTILMTATYVANS